MRRSPEQTTVTAGDVRPGDMTCGRLVADVKLDYPWVTLDLDDGSRVRANVNDDIVLDNLPNERIRFEPVFNKDGLRTGWRMVLTLDGDVQPWKLECVEFWHEFTVELSDSDIVDLSAATVTPVVITSMEGTP